MRIPTDLLRRLLPGLCAVSLAACAGSEGGPSTAAPVSSPAVTTPPLGEDPAMAPSVAPGTAPAAEPKPSGCDSVPPQPDPCPPCGRG
jgi:hypothetical protein